MKAFLGQSVASIHGASRQHVQKLGIVAQNRAYSLNSYSIHTNGATSPVSLASDCQSGDGIHKQATGVLADLHLDHQRLHEVDRIADDPPVVRGGRWRGLHCMQALVHHGELVRAKLLRQRLGRTGHHLVEDGVVPWPWLWLAFFHASTPASLKPTRIG